MRCATADRSRSHEERPGGMKGRYARVVTTAVALAAAAVVLVLGVQNRALRQRNHDLIVRFTSPHPGMLVPAFSARSLAGDSVTIGASSLDERQVLFFF